MSGSTSEYTEPARRVLEGKPNPLEAIPYNNSVEEGKPKADETTEAELAARLIDLPETLRSPNYEDRGVKASEKWSSTTHYGNDGILIVNLLTHSQYGESRQTTLHVKPDFSVGVWTHMGAGTEPILLSQPLADALLQILPEGDTTTSEK